MRAIAKRRVLAVLASAQALGFGLRDGEFLRREFAALVRAVAKRLLFRLPTRAPPIIAGGEVDGIRRFLCNDGFGHDKTLQVG